MACELAGCAYPMRQEVLERSTAKSGLQQVTGAGRRSEGKAKKHVGENVGKPGSRSAAPFAKDERVGEP